MARPSLIQQRGASRGVRRIVRVVGDSSRLQIAVDQQRTHLHCVDVSSAMLLAGRAKQQQLLSQLVLSGRGVCCAGADQVMDTGQLSTRCSRFSSSWLACGGQLNSTPVEQPALHDSSSDSSDSAVADDRHFPRDGLLTVASICSVVARVQMPVHRAGWQGPMGLIESSCYGAMTIDECQVGCKHEYIFTSHHLLVRYHVHIWLRAPKSSLSSTICLLIAPYWTLQVGTVRARGEACHGR